MTPPKQQAFAVTLVHGDGPVYLGVHIAPSEAEASALAVATCYRNTIPEQYLTGVALYPIPLEWLRTAVKAMQTGAPGKVVQLVQPPFAAGARWSEQQLEDWQPSGQPQPQWHSGSAPPGGPPEAE